jgi:PilZ domain-containing protein
MEKARDGKGRRAPRLAVELPGSLMGRRSRAVTIVDLSLTGCLVRGDAALDTDQVLDLRTELDSAPFTAKVRVTESYLDGSAGSPASPRYLAGLAFLGLQAQEEARLRRFLDEERRRRRGADTPSR